MWGHKMSIQGPVSGQRKMLVSLMCACVCVCVCVCVCGEEVGEMERGGEELKSRQRETNPLATHAFNFFFHAFNF